MRTARIERKTKESSVSVELNLDGTGKVNVETGVPFFDHMMSQDRKSTRLNSSHVKRSRMPSSA